MPSKPRKQTPTPSTGAARRPGQSSPPMGNARQPNATGESDPSFNVISVLYHALQGADTAARYQRDAEGTGGDELAQFFEQTRTEYTARAKEAKRILAKMLGSSESEGEDESSDEDEDEEDEDEE